MRPKPKKSRTLRFRVPSSGGTPPTIAPIAGVDGPGGSSVVPNAVVRGGLLGASVSFPIAGTETDADCPDEYLMMRDEEQVDDVFAGDVPLFAAAPIAGVRVANRAPGYSCGLPILQPEDMERGGTTDPGIATAIAAVLPESVGEAYSPRLRPPFYANKLANSPPFDRTRSYMIDPSSRKRKALVETSSSSSSSLGDSRDETEPIDTSLPPVVAFSPPPPFVR